MIIILLHYISEISREQSEDYYNIPYKFLHSGNEMMKVNVPIVTLCTLFSSVSLY